jgi:hypothetical protein
MSQSRTTGPVAAITALLLLSGCASTPAPSANEQTHVGVVEVVRHDPGGAGFDVLLRETVLRQASFYGDGGRPITLRIELERVHFKNPLKAMLIGDDNQARGRVSVIDPATGQETAAFKVQVDAERGGMSGASIAMAVIGAFDPTGVVDIGSAAGSAASADINRSGTARAMSANFAAETLRQTYGDARAREVAKEAQARARAR